jgi:hypothetical protein
MTTLAEIRLRRDAATFLASEVGAQASLAGLGGACGDSTGSVNFRRMFDPRLTEEYCGVAGMPWSDQDASGELAAMAIGAALWGFYNQIGEFGSNVTKPNFIGCQYNYRHLQMPTREPGLRQGTGQRSLPAGLAGCDLRHMLGRRFYDETGGQYIANQGNPPAALDLGGPPAARRGAGDRNIPRCRRRVRAEDRAVPRGAGRGSARQPSATDTEINATE